MGNNVYVGSGAVTKSPRGLSAASAGPWVRLDRGCWPRVGVAADGARCRRDAPAKRIPAVRVEEHHRDLGALRMRNSVPSKFSSSMDILLKHVAINCDRAGFVSPSGHRLRSIPKQRRPILFTSAGRYVKCVRGLTPLNCWRRLDSYLP